MSLSQVISKELEEARNTCSEYGEGDPHCRAAWDAVEEVLAARSHQPVQPNSLEQFCSDNPESAECLIYDD
ncbi:Calvin cycle protein CP12 [Synechococcus sp. PCC 7336]|uniref:Calvin cycle protein CP12 n=1 Tax=Synechococcus sp. PCC 7336 TaxID=195250 RepID=UPI000348EF67|nr:CP12 domain-containing protein [Synechococcus sp. PCC 7336]